MTTARDSYARLMINSIDATLSRLFVQVREDYSDESPWITVSEHFDPAYAEKMTASLNNPYAARTVAGLLRDKENASIALKLISSLL